MSYVSPVLAGKFEKLCEMEGMWNGALMSSDEWIHEFD